MIILALHLDASNLRERERKEKKILTRCDLHTLSQAPARLCSIRRMDAILKTKQKKKKQPERSTILSFIVLFICVILPPSEEKRCRFGSLLFLVASILSLLFLPLAPLFSTQEKIIKQIKLQLFMKKKNC